MARYMTDSVLAGAYRNSDPRSTLTHVVDTQTKTVLCGRVKYDSMAGDTSEEGSKATCKTCAKRDPRSQGNGPRSLTHLLQF